MPAQPSHKPSEQDPGGQDPQAPALRADARRNRERILEAARQVFADQGVDAPTSAVARRAGVGAATLYRRFPTRDALVTAAFAEQLDVCAAAFDEALADPDPGRGLYVLLEKVCATQATDRGFAPVFMDRFADALAHDPERACAEERMAHLVRRARESGQLRADFHPSDITLLLLASGSLAGQPRDTALAASRRLLASFLQGFRTQRPGPLPPPAPLEPSRRP
ncbi:TetR/AcrR family transcriptional regulator [Streptomyces silvensis]|uniref:TetR family transcriptional regulator n=1 Tax=Streptomyces silvensis TaxID=1765722 RepID=A0A0W7X9B5_9ACTN|nr:TetR/AcrR family transcriptional regulator [Streptomyces silvensis]KUF19332.1 TetR family transcriptional regulator [Streptomyces silvensis]